MPHIAREFNHSETTFVLAHGFGHTAKVRIFTPGGELRFAYHPTIGTAHVWRASARSRSTARNADQLEEGVGPVPGPSIR
jgi:trans-2,3-dihydro-3-hydroxyanthranilate isomerase